MYIINASLKIKMDVYSHFSSKHKKADYLSNYFQKSKHTIKSNIQFQHLLKIMGRINKSQFFSPFFLENEY